eukprot:comp42462_c0_seq1/m.47456 comp42462_c0_seq1/g.47456  ORF comp42462_c0_seq1/g.47456 comp42462_c0_seq1/m.47456 type:complete len:364 (-) comp42462_c0_seq1:29-1120(-)
MLSKVSMVAARAPPSLIASAVRYRSLSTDQSGEKKKRLIFSGIQPTGVPTLGNYIGTLTNWVELQHTAEKCVYSIVDLHSITVPQPPDVLRDNILDMTISLLAVGVDPKKCVIFQQSRVSQHTQLAWVLGTVTPFGMLNKMTQWKDKKAQHGNKQLGLFSYPVLQAADILLYNATHVPVGEDQRQHLELTRDIAGFFNNRYNTDYLVLPEVIYSRVQRVMSLRDPHKKMSKSDPNDNARINLTDSADLIREKIRKAVTDGEAGIVYDPEKRLALANLIDLYAAMAGMDVQAVVNENSHIKSKLEFKDRLADVIIDRLVQIQNEIYRLRKEKAYVKSVLEEGAKQAQALAEVNYKRVEEIIGFA